MAIYPRKDYTQETPGFQVDGYNCCPICQHINLIYPTSVLKVNPFTGKPFHLPPRDSQKDSIWYPYNTSDFPSYNSWFCVDNGHIFRQPGFVTTSNYSGFIPVASGDVQWQF
jgi:hypothetical protein